MSLRVWLHGEPVGTLVVDHADWIRFDVAEDYWEREPRPIISLALESDRGRSVTRSHLALPPLFSNLLPEGALRDQIASHHGLDIRREMPLLERLGEDLAGALCFTELARDDGPPAPPELVSGDAAWAFSAVAGMQPKFTTERQGKGLVLAAKGHGERWIVKTTDGKFDRLPETEELMTRWARAAGITTVEARLVDREEIEGLPDWIAQDGGRCFASLRYDRTPSGRVHQEDFCQVFNVRAPKRYEAATYDRLLRTVFNLCGADDARELLRRLVFMILSGNTDLHLKNWSIYYPQQVAPRLAPAYDLVATVPFISKRTTALRLARENQLSVLSLLHLRDATKGLGPLCDEVDSIVRTTVHAAMDSWHGGLRAELDPRYVAAMDDLHADMALLRDLRA